MELPIHPALVHFPIAFYLLECFLISLWLFKRDEKFREFSLLVFRLAFLSMVAALITGWIDAGGWEGIQGKVRLHFLGALSVTVIQSLRGLYWYLGKPRSSKETWICFGGALLGCAAVIYTAYYGGELVYGME